jgi:hypothetical protein
MASIDAQNVNLPGYTEKLKEEKYTIIKDAILSVLGPPEKPEFTFDQLSKKVKSFLEAGDTDMSLFPKPGSVRWYTKTVQLDLEARGLIERIPKSSPMKLKKV